MIIAYDVVTMTKTNAAMLLSSTSLARVRAASMRVTLDRLNPTKGATDRFHVTRFKAGCRLSP